MTLVALTPNSDTLHLNTKTFQEKSRAQTMEADVKARIRLLASTPHIINAIPDTQFGWIL